MSPRHDTRASRKAAGFDASAYWEFQPGQRVKTVDGILGTVQAVLDGPGGGSEVYEVSLDGSLGGGHYSASQLALVGGEIASQASISTEAAATTMLVRFRSSDPWGFFQEHFGTVSVKWMDQGESGIYTAEILWPEGDERSLYSLVDSGVLLEANPSGDLATAAAVEGGLHVASEDYPELEDILVDRPPLEGSISVAASRRSASWIVTDDRGNILYGPVSDSFDAKDKRDELAATTGGEVSVQSYTEPEGWDGWASGGNQLSVGKEYPMGDFRASLTETPVGIRSVAGPGDWLADRINNALPESVRDDGRGRWSYDWCRFRRDERCYYPSGLDEPATIAEGRAIWVPQDRGFCTLGTWEGQKGCSISEPGPNSGENPSYTDATIPYSQGGQREGRPGPVRTGSRIEEAAGDLVAVADLISTSLEDDSFRFHVTASWRDVQQKAKRIREKSGVKVISVAGTYIVAEVQGDTNTYETRLQRMAGSSAVAMWECGCKWATYSWGRSGRWKKYEGRMCSHALALTYEAQAQEWMGGTIKEGPGFGDAQQSTPGRSPSWTKGPTKRKRKAGLQAEAMPAIKANPTIEEIAAWYAATAKREDTFTTPLINRLARENGGTVEGLQYRLKEQGKIKDKLVRKNFDPRLGSDPRMVLDDSLRYTIVFHPADYAAQVQDVLFGLQEANYEIVKEENSWLRGDPYSDLSYVIATPADFRFELQFHTKESLELKQKTLHKMYEEFRAPATPKARRQELFDLMTAHWDKVEIPPDVLEYPVQKRYLRPASLDRSLAPSLASVIASESNITFTEEGLYQLLGELALPPYPDGNGGWLAGSEQIDCAPIAQHIQERVEQERIASLRVISADGPDMDGCMIALRPPDAVCGALAQAGGEDVENMHVTVAYLGKAADINVDALHQLMAAFSFGAKRLTGRVGGMGVFDNPNGKVLVALMDIPGLDEWRARLMEWLGDAGIEVPNNHGFTPHLTVAYQDDHPEVPEVPAGASGDFDFDTFFVACGSDWTYYTMGEGDLGEGTLEAAAVLHDEPEPALPVALGSEDEDPAVETALRSAQAAAGLAPPHGYAGLEWLRAPASTDSGDIAAAARQFLATGKPPSIQAQAGKVFSPAEQQEIINEGEGVTASNLGSLDIKGTHYEALEASLTDDSLW